jgi:hypothetical protein
VPKFQVLKDNKVLKEFDDAMDTAIFALNNEYGPGMDIYTNDKEASETWTHFDYKENL